MYQNLVNSFIPKSMMHLGEALRAERIFINVLLISALADLLGIGLATELHLTIIIYLLIANAGINFSLLFAYKFGLPKLVATHIFLLQHAISFMLQAWQQGGLISPATGAYFLLPAVTILIIGKRAALLWFIVTVLIITCFYIYESEYGAPIVSYPIDKKDYLFYAAVLGTNISIFIILIVYENSKNKALQLAEKRHRDLETAQVQLIQSEKMASLGELTAGIAHEIQNPLNFVNNFSEVNVELLNELKQALEKGDWDEAKSLSNSAIENQEKVNNHGKRADAIVKGMLQHSRSSSGQKEPTDINLLCDEFLRLSYHGLRAKDKSFNAKFETDFDSTLPRINIVPQDVGRVILNLINNAFYSVNEKRATNNDGYEPTVTVSTKNIGDEIEIRVKDNGNGIPDSIKEKIFQPFFTTKPTGQGTGLGLSLSYDIITKSHNGEIKVESKMGEGTTFILVLPK